MKKFNISSWITENKYGVILEQLTGDCFEIEANYPNIQSVCCPKCSMPPSSQGDCVPYCEQNCCPCDEHTLMDDPTIDDVYAFCAKCLTYNDAFGSFEDERCECCPTMPKKWACGSDALIDAGDFDDVTGAALGSSEFGDCVSSYYPSFPYDSQEECEANSACGDQPDVDLEMQPIQKPPIEKPNIPGLKTRPMRENTHKKLKKLIQNALNELSQATRIPERELLNEIQHCDPNTGEPCTSNQTCTYQGSALQYQCVDNAAIGGTPNKGHTAIPPGSKSMTRKNLKKLIRTALEEISEYKLAHKGECAPNDPNYCSKDDHCTHGETGEVVGECVNHCCVTYNKPTLGSKKVRRNERKNIERNGDDWDGCRTDSAEETCPEGECCASIGSGSHLGYCTPCNQLAVKKIKRNYGVPLNELEPNSEKDTPIRTIKKRRLRR